MHERRLFVALKKLDFIEHLSNRLKFGNHVDGEYRHGGSNPPLSATAEALSEMTELFSCFSGEGGGFPGREKGAERVADIISL